MKSRFTYLIVIGVFFLFSFFFQDEIKNFFYNLSLPFQKSLSNLKFFSEDTFKIIFQRKEIIKENERLEKKVERLLREVQKLKDLEKENETLRKALELKKRKDFNFFLSQFVSKSIDSPDEILIKGGEREGIKEGLPVITPEGVLIGKTNKIFKNFSQVKLISEKDFSFGVKVLNKEGVMGIIKGKGDLKIHLEKVPSQAKLEKGDILVTIYLGGEFPEGLLVGKIAKIEKSDLEHFQSAEITPFFKKDKLENLLIITEW